MMIRDTGSTVEFWLKAGSQTFNYQLPWGYTVNGVTSSTKYFSFQPGGAWQKLGSWTVSYSQTVTFRLYASGTSGLGGPTTFSQAISRATVPGAPSVCRTTSPGSTAWALAFDDGSNGGAAIDARQIGLGTDGSHVTTWYSSDGSTFISGLTKGTTYYAWARCHNVEGWGPLGPRFAFTTWREPDAPDQPVLSSVLATSVHVSFTDNGNGGTAITDHRVGYGTSTSGPTSYVSGNSVDITGLTPGQTYYFWAQAKNSIGWSPLSPVQSTKALSGARILVGTTWKTAIPYVRVGGVWKIAQPYVRYAGNWKEAR